METFETFDFVAYIEEHREELQKRAATTKRELFDESLDYIIDRMEQSAADNTLDEIEEELSALREELNDTRR